MTGYKNGHIVAPWLCSAAILCLQACTVANLDLCRDEHPHKGQLIVEYDWSDMDGDHPDSMVVMALRPIFRDKVATNWASDATETENRLFGRYIVSATGEDYLYYATYEDNPSRDSLFLPAGEWSITSYTSNKSTIERAENYVTDIQDDGKSLIADLAGYEQLPEKYAYWYDRNPYSNWVDANMNSSICLASGTVTIDEYANVKKDYKVTLKPRIVAQKVNVGFEAEVVDADITVDSIVCSISGIAHAMNISTMALDITTTHKTIFETELSTATSGYIIATSTIYVPGLVRNPASTNLQGPGILNVSVFVHFIDSKGIRRERRLDGTVNLYRLLTATPSVQYDVDGKVIQACPELDLFVRGTMLISKDKLSNADDALDAWMDETIIDVEN